MKAYWEEVEWEDVLQDVLAQLLSLGAHPLRKLLVLPAEDRTPGEEDAPHPAE